MVAPIVPEPHSAAVARWYGRSRAKLVSAIWRVTEFASALGIKQRTGQIDAAQAQEAWSRFERLIAGDLALLPPVAVNFHRAAALALDASAALRAGDALHLACAEHVGAKAIATLDVGLGRTARQFNIKPIVFS